MNKQYFLVLGIYENGERVNSHVLIKKSKRFDAIIHFPDFYAKKKTGEYDELIKNRMAFIELEEIQNGKTTSIEEVEIRR